jgi:hypothetical protein
MSRFDDRLTRELEHAAKPPDHAGVFDEIDRRRRRRAVVRRVHSAALATVVLAGSVVGVLVLNRAFRGASDQTPGIQVSPYPIAAKDNGLLAFADGDRVFTVSPKGGDPEPVAGLPRGAWLPAWSPDGTQLAVAVFRGPTREIWVVNTDGSGARQVAVADNVSQPGWSPDGTEIVYAADTQEGSAIHLVNSDGSNDRAVGGSLPHRDYFSAAFSPDGTKLLYDAGTDSGFGIFVMNLDGSGVIQLNATDQDYDPSWSPDGTQIVFTRQEEGAESDIWVMDADGTNVRRLTNDGPGSTNLYPTFSPDGSKIAYVAGVTGGPGALEIMNADGGDPVELVPNVLGISWQPLVRQSSEPSVSTAAGRDIGLGFNLCRLEALNGIDFLGDDVNGTAWVGTRLTKNRSCPALYEGESIVAVDVDGDGSAESWAGPLARCIGCSPFDTTDLNADGTLELVVTLQYGSVTEYTLFALQPVPGNGPPELQQVTVAEPGSLPNFRAGKPVSLWAGGDEGYSARIECENYPDAPVLIATTGDHPVEGPGSETRTVERTRLVLGTDGTISVQGTERFTEPTNADPSAVSFTGRACGVAFYPWA